MTVQINVAVSRIGVFKRFEISVAGKGEGTGTVEGERDFTGAVAIDSALKLGAVFEAHS